MRPIYCVVCSTSHGGATTGCSIDGLGIWLVPGDANGCLAGVVATCLVIWPISERPSFSRKKFDDYGELTAPVAL